MQNDIHPAQRPRLVLNLLKQPLAVCRLDKDLALPDWACQGAFCSMTRTPQELSVVCPEENIPPDAECETGWRAFSSEGPLGFAATGLVETLAEPLALAGISIFFISTFYTDYVMVKQEELQIAIMALESSGHTVRRE